MLGRNRKAGSCMGFPEQAGLNGFWVLSHSCIMDLSCSIRKVTTFVGWVNSWNIGLFQAALHKSEPSCSGAVLPPECK